MAMMERPIVSAFADGGKYWEHEYEKFYLKTYNYQMAKRQKEDTAQVQIYLKR